MPDEAPATRRLPKRIVHVQLADPYSDFSADLWVNVPPPLWNDLLSNDLATCAAAFDQLVVKHDLVDFDGQPYPQADGAGTLYRALPADVIAAILQARNGQVGRLSPRSAGS